MSEGRYVGAGDDAGGRVVSQWEEISDRNGEIVPAYGVMQAEREVANAGLADQGNTSA